jgi:hypothetical protein
MARIRKRKIRWNPSPAPDVAGYKLYWAVEGGVNYDCDCAELGRRTEVILPDDIPSFPLVDGEIELGITAVNEIGNESDMTTFSAPFEFSVPNPPGDLVVETVQDYYVYHEIKGQPEAPETGESEPESWHP